MRNTSLFSRDVEDYKNVEIEFVRAALIDLDGSYFVQLIMFLLLWGILTPLVFKPYLKVKKVEEDLTDGRRKQALELEADAAKLLEEYRERLKQTRGEGQKVLNELREEGRQARDQILQKERAQLQVTMQKEMERVHKQEAEINAQKEKIARELSTLIQKKVMEVER